MTRRAAETSAFQLSWRTANCLKIEILIKYFSIFRKNRIFIIKKYFFNLKFLFLEEKLKLKFLFLDSRRPAESYLHVKKSKNVEIRFLSIIN
jgi:hypothetical protein